MHLNTLVLTIHYISTCITPSSSSSWTRSYSTFKLTCLVDVRKSVLIFSCIWNLTNLNQPWKYYELMCWLYNSIIRLQMRHVAFAPNSNYNFRFYKIRQMASKQAKCTANSQNDKCEQRCSCLSSSLLYVDREGFEPFNFTIDLWYYASIRSLVLD